MINGLWVAFGQKVGRTARIGLVVGGLGIILATAFAGYWLLRTDYQVLFADLTTQDASAMTAELDRLKTPFIISDEGPSGTTILVDKNEVHKTRIKLMGKEIPLHGAVGFELFNNSDFGMTEFAQKINYQRALQGELTRTILSLAEIRDARVLLALPEQGLFKQATNKPKASVTITMKPGQRLRNEQVAGIQRLVSAAVPGILSQDVTLVDQSGVALSRVSGDGISDMASGSGSLHLDLKKEIETYLSRKAADVLDRALGPRQAMASVDVTLDLDRVQSNTDEILSVPGKSDEVPTGVLVRQRETTREAPAPLNARTADAQAISPGNSNQSESEYIVGHRVEQVFRHPGSIQCMKVAVVTQKALTPDQQDQLKKMVAASIGVSFERGDEVVVQTTVALASTSSADSAISPQSESEVRTLDSKVETNRSLPQKNTNSSPILFPDETQSLIATRGIWALVGLVLLGTIGWWWLRRGIQGRDRNRGMSNSEREAALAQVEAWLNRSSGARPPSAVDPTGVKAKPGTSSRVGPMPEGRTP